VYIATASTPREEIVLEELSRSRILLRAPINHPLPYFIQATKFTIKTFVSSVCVNIHLHIHIHVRACERVARICACVWQKGAVGCWKLRRASPLGSILCQMRLRRRLGNESTSVHPFSIKLLELMCETLWNTNKCEWKKRFLCIFF
jgi:hypothetical protein